MRRPRQAPIHPRTDEVGSSSALMQETTSVVTPPMAAPLTDFVFRLPSLMYYMPMTSTFSMQTMPMTIYTHTLFVSQTPLGSLFYQGGSFSKPSIPRPKDARWQPMQSTEGEEDKRLKPEP
ncbi:hypothetical protein GOBAR_AA37272 [Gossypium barbadense]|uniref:Uncharacterized protein n=1 Tax=Gossypium barbadense TaxID=3634 RepID=A0A2P5VXA7_GOSBA|nr:hypothetical protein GOBAR_AA37272 [Gossypium barbadense]